MSYYRSLSDNGSTDDTSTSLAQYDAISPTMDIVARLTIPAFEPRNFHGVIRLFTDDEISQAFDYNTMK
jgi:hypothetical protein